MNIKHDDLDSYSLKDRNFALEVLKLREAAKLTSDYHERKYAFKRNEKLSHVSHATLNFFQFIFSTLDEIFHHVHHEVNRRIRLSDPDYPFIPEARNPVFFVYPTCMVLSLILFILWLCTKTLERHPGVALFGNIIGALFMVSGGISAMRHAEKHINLNLVQDEELFYHPIFIHNYVLCIISLIGMMLYLISAWILYEVFQHRRNQRKTKPLPRSRGVRSKYARGKISRRGNYHCRCMHHKTNYSQKIEHSNNNDFDLGSLSVLSGEEKEEIENSPIILYCCCIDFYRYLNHPHMENVHTHEFQVIQIM